MKLDRVLQYSQAYNFFQWVFGKHAPEPGVVFVSQRRVYILHMRHGLTFGLAVILMLIGSINYNLSLGYVLTFLLAGLGIVSIPHTFRNLAHLYVSAGRVAPVLAGDTAQFELVFENKGDFDRHSLDLACRGARVRCDVPARQHRSVALPVKAENRGWLQLERVTVDTRFPLGLMRAWSYVQPDLRALVYPRPDSAPLPLAHSDAETGAAVSAAAAAARDADRRRDPHGGLAHRVAALLGRRHRGRAPHLARHRFDSRRRPARALDADSADFRRRDRRLFFLSHDHGP